MPGQGLRGVQQTCPRVAPHSLAGTPPSTIPQLAGNLAGLLLILVAGNLMAIATLRWA